MATYAVGDLQGCLEPLQRLLAAMEFDPRSDTLWLVGDLVNRGPESAAVLRFVRSMEERAVAVLGNHDLHLIATALVPGRKFKPRDTLQDVLDADDGAELIDWLRRQPLARHDPKLAALMVHAGVPANWSVADTLKHAADVEAVLRDDRACGPFLENMYGNSPRREADADGAMQRRRYVVNALTRMRYCAADGALNFRCKGAPGSQDPGLAPWFELPGRRCTETTIVFGHWSTLSLSADQARRHNICPLDTGAVWGGTLTGCRLDDGALFSVAGEANPVPLS